MIEPKRIEAGLLAHAERLLEGLTPGKWEPWAGSGWPPALVKLFGGDEAEQEIGVIWPIAPEGTGHGGEGEYHIWCREARDQDFVAHAPDVVRALLAHIKAQDEEIKRLAPPKALTVPYGVTTHWHPPDQRLSRLLIRSTPDAEMLGPAGLLGAQCAHLVPLLTDCAECDTEGIPIGYRVAGPGCPGYDVEVKRDARREGLDRPMVPLAFFPDAEPVSRPRSWLWRLFH